MNNSENKENNFISVGFEALQKVNATIKTTNIKGKEYAEVPQRIKAFRMLFPLGRIVTDIVKLEGDMVVMKASVYIPNPTGDYILIATGLAYEREKGMINSTSVIENCETSAIGRALGIAGFGIDTAVASAEEVSNAIAQQEQNAVESKKITPEMVAGLLTEAKEHNLTAEDVCAAYKVSSMNDLTMAQMAQIRRNWKKLTEWKEKQNASESKAENA